LVPGERFELPTNGLQNRWQTLITLNKSPACHVCVVSTDQFRRGPVQLRLIIAAREEMAIPVAGQDYSRVS
jgi:hypothetical protein